MNYKNFIFTALLFCVPLAIPALAQEPISKKEIEKRPLHSDIVPASNYKNITAQEPEEMPQVCQILSDHLNSGTLNKLVTTDKFIDLDGDGALEQLVPIVRNNEGLARSYDIISQGEEEEIAGVGFKDALSVLFLNIENMNYLWVETLPKLSLLQRFNAKKDNLWDMETICKFEREKKS